MGRICRWTPAAWFAFLVLLTPPTCRAQSRTTSAVRGTITTAGGEPVAGVYVVFRHEGMGIERMTQKLHVGSAEVRPEADVINLLNMVEGSWGRVETIRPVVTLIEPIRRSCTTCPLISQWSGTALPSREADGRLVATDPWSVPSPDSQWRIQLGARLTFGGVTGER